MITTINGDLLALTNIDVIAHQTNCMGVMGSGIAKQIRDKYPDVYNDFRHLYRQGQTYLGHCFLDCVMKNEHDTDHIGPKYIANLYGQKDYGREPKCYTNYDALREAFVKLRDQMQIRNLYSLALPYKMGCGLAGGDWTIVKQIIRDTFESTNINVTIIRKVSTYLVFIQDHCLRNMQAYIKGSILSMYDEDEFPVNDGWKDIHGDLLIGQFSVTDKEELDKLLQKRYPDIDTSILRILKVSEVKTIQE